MKKLEDILESIKVLETNADPEMEILGVALDSRKVVAGMAFLAIRGTEMDGHTYTARAVDAGAKVILLQDKSFAPEDVPYVVLEDTRHSASLIAGNFYDHPSESITLVGVTGTNGKTTIATLLFDLYSSLGYKCALLSTISNRVGEEVTASTLTTPDAVSLQALFAEMRDKHIEFAFMEVSSHALDQGRVSALDFDGAVFTNITHDHLDYHKDFRSYLYAKKKLFDMLKPEAFALVNADDRNAGVLTQNTEAKVHTYALKKPAAFKGRVIHNDIAGLHMDIDDTELYLKLIGYFNAYNCLAAYGVALLTGHDKTEVLARLSGMASAEGRMDVLRDTKRGFTAVVDYAHTPDALENVLKTLVSVKDKNSALITLVGCGGNRDKTKRPKMGRLGALYSDTLVLTSDNPRDEDPSAIIEDMLEGIDEQDREKVIRLADRKEAIKLACRLAKSGDIILVAGKGHENYQEIKGQRFPFDDKKILSAFMH